MVREALKLDICKLLGPLWRVLFWEKEPERPVQQWKAPSKEPQTQQGPREQAEI